VITDRASGRRGRRFKSCHSDHCSALSERISIVALELVALSQVGPIQMGKGAARRARAAVRHLQAAVSLSGTGSAVRPGQGACDLARADAQLVL
jgi:hypothetical protein